MITTRYSPEGKKRFALLDVDDAANSKYRPLRHVSPFPNNTLALILLDLIIRLSFICGQCQIKIESMCLPADNKPSAFADLFLFHRLPADAKRNHFIYAFNHRHWIKSSARRIIKFLWVCTIAKKTLMGRVNKSRRRTKCETQLLFHPTNIDKAFMNIKKKETRWNMEGRRRRGNNSPSIDFTRWSDSSRCHWRKKRRRMKNENH